MSNYLLRWGDETAVRTATVVGPDPMGEEQAFQEFVDKLWGAVCEDRIAQIHIGVYEQIVFGEPGAPHTFALEGFELPVLALGYRSVFGRAAREIEGCRRLVSTDFRWEPSRTSVVDLAEK